MILSFMAKWPEALGGYDTNFVTKILSLKKIHTVRVDPNDRWNVGRKIHFAHGVRTKSYKQFASGIVKAVRTFESYEELLTCYKLEYFYLFNNSSLFWRNDGFDSEEQCDTFFRSKFYKNQLLKLIIWRLL